MNNESGLVLIVDALNLFTRHYVAHPAVGSNGQHVGGIVGFLYSVIGLIERYMPTQVIVVWEGGGSTKKRSLYSEYKQGRRPAKLNRYYDDDLPDTVQNRNQQILVIIEALKHTPICQLYIPDCEADDVIGYISKYSYRENRKLIASSDRDFYQLLDNKTIIYSPTWKKLVTSKEVREKFRITTQNFCLAKSICGDASDNINGIKGVGFKTLAKRFPVLNEDNDVTIDDIINHSTLMIKEGSKVKAYQNIVENEDVIRRNWKLIYLDTGNLSSSQIKRITSSLDTFVPIKNKIQIMRILLREGIQTFNVDRMFLAMNHIGVKNG